MGMGLKSTVTYSKVEAEIIESMFLTVHGDGIKRLEYGLGGFCNSNALGSRRQA